MHNQGIVRKETENWQGNANLSQTHTQLPSQVLQAQMLLNMANSSGVAVRTTNYHRL